MLLLFGSYYRLLSCTCAGESYFCEEISDTTDSFLHPEYVLRGIKLKDTLHGMLLKIEYQYINEILADNILILGDTGGLCRVFTSFFEVGDTIILGINRQESESGIPDESIGDYWFPACGVTFLEIENGLVEGPISFNTTAMSLEEFDLYMENEEYNADCLTSGIRQFQPNDLKLYPNPAMNTAYVNCESCDGLALVSVYSVTGALINIPFYQTGNTIRLDVAGLEKGVYFVRLKNRDTLLNCKLLVI